MLLIIQINIITMNLVNALHKIIIIGVLPIATISPVPIIQLFTESGSENSTNLLDSINNKTGNRSILMKSDPETGDLMKVTGKPTEVYPRYDGSNHGNNVAIDSPYLSFDDNANVHHKRIKRLSRPSFRGGDKHLTDLTLNRSSTTSSNQHHNRNQAMTWSLVGNAANTSTYTIKCSRVLANGVQLGVNNKTMRAGNRSTQNGSIGVSYNIQCENQTIFLKPPRGKTKRGNIQNDFMATNRLVKGFRC